MLSNVFFDLDGTLTDPKKGITGCIRYALQRLGRGGHREADLTRFIGPPVRHAFAKILATDDNALIEKAVDLYREKFSETGIFENEVYPGIEELLAFLHRQSFSLYVVTSKPKIFAEKIVRHFKFDAYFRDVFGPSLKGRFDDKGELIGFILQKLSIRPAETVMIGDRREDIVAGKSNRTQTIGVTYGYGSMEEIKTSNPDYICQDPSEIRVAAMMIHSVG